MKSVKTVILDTLSDSVGNFLYYDRKEDKDLPQGRIDEAIAAGEITIDELVECFRSELIKGIR